MKTLEEIKKGLLCCSHSDMSCSECPYDGICRTDSGQTPEDDAAALIDHLLTIYSQVSKALCGKENADLEELLQAVSQVKNRLAQVERERDAALSEWKRTKMDSEGMCWTCKHGFITDIGSCRCISPVPCDEGENWEWRGLCEENTHDQPSM